MSTVDSISEGLSPSNRRIEFLKWKSLSINFGSVGFKVGNVVSHVCRAKKRFLSWSLAGRGAYGGAFEYNFFILFLFLASVNIC